MSHTPQPIKWAHSITKFGIIGYGGKRIDLIET
jgi:hypothetical protein